MAKQHYVVRKLPTVYHLDMIPKAYGDRISMFSKKVRAGMITLEYLIDSAKALIEDEKTIRRRRRYFQSRYPQDG